jgi:hypothetical protein
MSAGKLMSIMLKDKSQEYVTYLHKVKEMNMS